jgi:hypothetical protein
VLPSLGLCGLRVDAAVAVDVDCDSDEKACAGWRAEVDRLWADAMQQQQHGKGAGSSSWCMVSQKRCKSAQALLTHLRTDEHKQPEEDYVNVMGTSSSSRAGHSGSSSSSSMSNAKQRRRAPLSCSYSSNRYYTTVQ